MEKHDFQIRIILIILWKFRRFSKVDFTPLTYRVKSVVNVQHNPWENPHAIHTDFAAKLRWTHHAFTSRYFASLIRQICQESMKSGCYTGVDTDNRWERCMGIWVPCSPIDHSDMSINNPSVLVSYEIY